MIFLNAFNEMSHFGTAHRWGGCTKSTLSYLKSYTQSYNKIWCIYNLPEEVLKIYKSRDTPLEFW